MRTVTEIETNVPAFLGKLWKLVEDPDTDELICWSINGRSFFIRNPAQFARDLLPHYYKHNNMASFVRQLNMYGFHKKVSVELGGLKCDRDEMEFAHQYFVKDHPYLLEHIKRKIASNKMQDSHPPIKAEVMNKVLAEVRTMRGKQEHLDSKLGHMKQQNESLWREISVLRRKHAKQQEIVNKLIHFLVTLVQPNRNSGLSVKRRYPLMIDSHQRHKQAKTSKSGTSPTGPVIHELHETDPNTDLDSEYIVAEILENHHYPSVQSPKSTDDILDNEIQESEQLIEQSLAVDNDDDDEYLQTPVISPKRKHLLKPKRKRKHKVPVKITIPPTDIGEQLREETLMVEMNLDDEEVGEETLDVKKVPIIPQKMKDKKSVPIKAKPIPMKTVRSSKLAAMAANINKMSEQNDSDEDGDGDDDDDNDNNNNNNNDDDHDTDHDDLITNDTDDVNLDNMLIIPDMEKPNTFGASGSLSDTQQFNQNNPGSSDKTQDLSLSCINTLSGTDSDIREEIGSHVNEVQANIDMIRDQCMRGEFQSLDASALLSVLSCNDDLMGSYDDFPMNPDFDIISREGNSEEQQNAGGELMAYNPTPSLLDFSEAMFNDIDNSSPVGTSALTECYNQDPLNLEDSKALLVESLLSDANANKSGNS